MTYITHKRFKGEGICGAVNVPAQINLHLQDNIIIYNNSAICFATSEIAHQYFARNDDGNGMERGNLTQAIQKALSKRDNNYQTRWDKIWEDDICQQYKREEYADYWLWNHKFFNADIEDLRYIAHLIGVKGATL